MVNRVVNPRSDHILMTVDLHFRPLELL